MLLGKDYKFWFCTGSQDLYGDECLAHVAEHSKIIVDRLNQSGLLPYEVVWKPTLITNELTSADTHRQMRRESVSVHIGCSEHKVVW